MLINASEYFCLRAGDIKVVMQMHELRGRAGRGGGEKRREKEKDKGGGRGRRREDEETRIRGS